MQIQTLHHESKLLGGNVIRIFDWDSADEIIKAESQIRMEHQPVYTWCETDATDLASIHKLEQGGYCFSEFRIHSLLRTEDVETGTRAFYPYVSAIISEEAQLETAVAILSAAQDDDRFSCDPLVGKAISKERHISNLRKSFHSYPNEFLLGVFNAQTDEMLAFRSGAILSKTEAHYYQYGVAPGKDFNHTAGMLEVFTIDYLKKAGIKLIHSVSTGFNIAELNRLIRDHEFHIASSTVIMRKVF